MKKKMLFLLITLFAFSNLSYGQFTFGVSPGLSFNSAYFGFKVADKIVPFIGIQYAGVSFDYEQTGEEYDYDISSVVDYSRTVNFKGSIFLPNIGVKYFAIQKNNLQAYAKVNFAKPIIKGNFEVDGEEIDEMIDQIDAVKVWVGEFGIGVEYFFDENFSVGGEFGLRHMNGKYNYTYDSDFYNPDLNGGLGGQQDTEITNDVSIKASPTYSRISLNFYF